MQNAPADLDARLSRASELAAYLREDPKAARKDPEELAQRFGIDARLVAQIQASSIAKGPKRTTRKADPMAKVKAVATRFGQAFIRFADHPVPFQLFVAAITGFADLIPRVGGIAATVTWLAFQSAALICRPQYRSVLISSGLLWILAGVLFLKDIGNVDMGDMPKPFNDLAGHLLIGFLVGMTFALLNLLVGGFFVILGGTVQIAVQKRKSASLSRQDLVSRMFAIQEQLDSAPAEVVSPENSRFAFVRKHLFLCAILFTVVPAILVEAVAIAYHVDPVKLQTGAQHYKTYKTGSGVVNVATLDASSSFIMLETILGLSVMALRVLLGFIATSWRRIWIVLGGLALGQALFTCLRWPLGILEPMTPQVALENLASNVFSAFITVVVVRFAVGFHRKLVYYRTGGRSDEASMMAELLEIRYRLSANPAQVSVLVVDAAGSTQMKRNADPLMVEYSFGRYQAWITEVVGHHGGKVEIRTGDGAICAFGNAERALDAAHEMQQGVEKLNAEQNRLSSPFRLRIALHAGQVQADLDKIQFTEVIDVAAHTEKYSPVGGIALTAPFINALPTLPDLPSTAVVDGINVYTISAV
jgi:class 3 adenylate cyclase